MVEGKSSCGPALECGDVSPLSFGATVHGGTKRGHVRALRGRSTAGGSSSFLSPPVFFVPRGLSPQQFLRQPATRLRIGGKSEQLSTELRLSVPAFDLSSSQAGLARLLHQLLGAQQRRQVLRNPIERRRHKLRGANKIGQAMPAQSERGRLLLATSRCRNNSEVRVSAGRAPFIVFAARARPLVFPVRTQLQPHPDRA